MGGTLWRDLYIGNFVDLGGGSAPLAFDCTDRTYVGHGGHDANILGFREQQIGVPVFAALDGVVVGAHDGEPDMNLQALGQPGNYVFLSHGNGQTSIYHHLKWDSVAVTVGQSVAAGTQITRNGAVTTFAGLAGTSGNTDGTGSAARFNFPRGVAVDAAGTVYVADSNNNTIRAITPGGVVTTLAGSAGVFGSLDGTGGAARFGGPQGITVDGTGTLYVADTYNQTIRKVTAGGVVTTISGGPGCIGGDYWGRFNTPGAIAVNAHGELYVADTRNNTIRTDAALESSLVVDFGAQYGIWMRRGTELSQVHPSSAEAMLRIRDGDRDGILFDFGPGVGVWFWERNADGSDFWLQIPPQSPTAMLGVDADGDGEVESAVFNFAGLGCGCTTRMRMSGPRSTR